MGSKGTIVYTGGFELPDKNAAAQRVLANAALFRSLGYKVVLIGVSKESGGWNRGSVNGFDFYSVDYPVTLLSWTRYLCRITAIRRVLKLYEDVKAIICYNYPAIAMYRIKTYCDKRGIKVIGDTTEWYSPTGGLFFRLIKSVDIYLRMYVVQQRLTALIPTSKYLYSFYKSRNTHLLILPTLVDLDDAKWSVERSPRDGRRVRLVYAGSTGADKDQLSQLLRLLSRAKQAGADFELRIVGLSLEQYCNRFSVEGVPESVRGNVCFLGRMPHREVIREITNADFSVFLREVSVLTSAGFPTKFSESISCGTPVLTTRTSDLEDYVIEGLNGFFVDTQDEGQSVQELTKILQLDELTLDSMQKYCRQSRLMDYRNFADRAKTFMDSIGL